MHRLLCLGQVRLLGPDGQPAGNAAAQPRRLALLAVLGRMAPKAVSRERLLGWFWPEADEERGRRSLNQALYALRTELGSEEVLLGQRDLRLNLDLVSCDVAEFATAIASGRPEEAAALYQGPFLDGFHLSGTPQFSQWADEERTALAQQYHQVLESLAGTAEQRGDLAGAVRWWRRVAAADPASGRVAQRLMQALSESGDRAGAIRHATIYEAIVRQQFDLPPDPSVLALAEELKRAPQPPPRVAPAAAGPPAAVAPVLDRSALPHVSPPPATAVAEPDVGVRRSGSRTRGLAIGAAAVLLAVGALTVRSLLSRSPTPDDQQPLVAVLPLDNVTGDSTFNLAGAMVTDWLTHELAVTGLVRVIDSRTLLSTSDDVPALLAHTPYVVHGRVFRDGDSLRFMTQISDGRTGEIRLSMAPVSAPVGEPSAALSSLHQQVTGALAQLVDSRLNNFAAVSSRPPTWAAYQEFLLGQRKFARPYHASLAHFLRAIELDSGYTQAQLWTGNTLANLRRYREADSVFRRVAARRDQLAPYDQANLDYFHGGYVMGDWELSYRGAEAMAALGPQAAHAQWAVGHTARFTNRPRQAIAALSSISLESGWAREWAPRILGEIARNHHMLGQHDRELEQARRALSFQPDDGWVRTNEVIALAAGRRYADLARRVEAAMMLPEAPASWETYSGGDLLMQVARELAAHGAPADTVRRYADAAVTWHAAVTIAGTTDTMHLLGHARAAATAGRHAEARELYDRLVATSPASPEFVAGLAVSAARLGDTAAAESGLRRLQEMNAPYQFGYPARWGANVAAVLGRNEEAVRLLAESLRKGHTWQFRWHADPDLASLREYQPFRDLLRPR